MILTQDNEYAVLLDACVLVPMPLCDTLLRLAEEPAFYRPLWSEGILQEVGDALEKKLHRSPIQVQRRLVQMREAFPEASVEVPADLIQAMGCIPDTNDRHVLAAAIRGNANAIITVNTRHFPVDCLDQYGIDCQTPDEFLVHQFHLDPEQILDKLDGQSSNIGKDRPYIIERLRVMVPTFAALVEYGPRFTQEEG
jgi:predicted nucleic acid-binding protein